MSSLTYNKIPIHSEFLSRKQGQEYHSIKNCAVGKESLILVSEIK